MPYSFQDWFHNQQNGGFWNGFPWNQPQQPTTTPVAPTTSVTDPMTGRSIDTSPLKGAGADQSAAAVLEHGFSLDQLFQQNKNLALSGLNSLLNTATSEFMNPTPLNERYVRNLVSLGVGQVGQQGLAAEDALNQSLASRGIGGNSPLAAGLRYQLQTQNLGGVRNAQLNAETEALRLMAQQRALGLQTAAGLGTDIAKIQLAVPEYGRDALEGLPELELQKHYIDKAAKAGKKQSDNSLIGSIIGGVGSAIGAIGSLF